ncbi:MAG: hypothetical protein ACXW18_09195 [Pyrinomonadaceae bacterium]
MHRANFCVECGDRLARSGWRARIGTRFCPDCARRLGTFTVFRFLILTGLIALAAFALGRYLRPAAPPLIIQRAANSPLSDAPFDVSQAARHSNQNAAYAGTTNPSPSVANDEGYICGARTKKGTPCKRRVHAVGERCFQHKGLAAMVPPEKLIVKPANSSK